MIFKSILLAEARGSVAGATFSRNGNSAYVRAKGIPVNPRSPRQTDNRALLNTISSRWKSLVDAQRTAWNALAKTIPYTNKVGDSSFYSGFQLYMKLNIVFWGVNNMFLDEAPAAAPTFPAFTQAGFISEQDAAVLTDFTINLFTDLVGTGTGFVAEFQATNIISAGKAFIPKNLYRRVLLIDPVVGALPQVLSPSWVAVYGIPTQSFVGNRVAARFRLIDKTTGFTTTWTEVSTVVAEA